MNIAIIDFETRSKCPIKAGASRYSLEAEVMCLSYSLDSGVTVKSWAPGEPDPVDLFEHVKNGGLVFAHNATFEINIWQNVMVAKYGWPTIELTQWRCTMSEAMAVGLPSGLDKIADGMRLAIQKDMKGKRTMQKMSKPRKPTKKDKSEWHEKDEDKATLRAYCDQDVLAEAAVHAAIPRLNAREIQVYHYDQRMNARGIPVDRELAEAALWLWSEHTKELNTELAKITNGEVTTSREVAAMRNFLKSQGVDIPDLAKATVSTFLDLPGLPKLARRVLQIRAELALSSVSKYEAVLRSVEPDNRVRGCLQYHAAQTGRWGGRLIQVQNFPRGVLEKWELERIVALVKSRNIAAIRLLMPLGELLSSLLRSVIVAPPGKKFIVSDFNAIEARGLAWAAGEEWLLEAFRKGEDPYCGMASTIYGRTITKKDKDERFLGKQVILGAGYSMGASKFQMSVEVLAKAQGIQIDTSSAFCEKVIKTYREKNQKIKAHWYATERAALNAMQSGGKHEVGPFVYYRKGDWLFCRMPAGRSIGYYKPQVVPGQYGPQIVYLKVDITGKLVKNHTYGGSLVENNVQAVCRDLLVDAMSRLERAKYPLIMSVHDETVSEVDEDFGSAHEVEQIMSEVPEWAKGFPIAAEGFECRRYRK